MPTDDDLLRVVISELGQSTAVVELRGELDISNKDAVRSRLERLAGDGVRDLVLDLRDLEFIDSSGLSVLVGTHQLLENLGGRLGIRAPKPQVFKVMEISGLVHVLGLTHGAPPAGARVVPNEPDEPAGRDQPSR